MKKQYKCLYSPHLFIYIIIYYKMSTLDRIFAYDKEFDEVNSLATEYPEWENTKKESISTDWISKKTKRLVQEAISHNKAKREQKKKQQQKIQNAGDNIVRNTPKVTDYVQ